MAATNGDRIAGCEIGIPRRREDGRPGREDAGAGTLASCARVLDEDRRAVNRSLAELRATHSTRIGAAARHLLDAGGKRLRPLLTCAVLRSLGGDPRDYMPLVAVSELVHAGSLLHDDVVDGSTKRRGRPSTHVAYDTHTAILTGDLMLAWAFDRLARTASRDLQIAMAATIRDLSEGEVLERERHFDASADVAHVRLVNRLKTGALIAFAAEAGAILARSGATEREAARRFGLAAGEAFQAADDLLDWEGEPVQMGKPIGQDLADGLVTLPVAIGAERDAAVADDVRAFWASPPGMAERPIVLGSLRSRLERVDAFGATREMARDDAARAVEALRALPAGPWRDQLAAMARGAAARSR